MAGKSVYIRQVALIVLLAQVGSFVPAAAASLSPVDKIFVRSGASDSISTGQSTFMVEMVETAGILNNATDQSLIVMDEIGRGTSTYDGISIAWSVAEYLVANKVGPKTLFATHYHELQELENKYPERIKNYHVEVAETDGVPVFLRKLVRGGAEHSFGIHVAKLAGIPDEVCENALKVLNALRGDFISDPVSRSAIVKSDALVADGSTIIFSEKLRDLDLSRTTPLEALNILAALKQILDRD